mgnify:CR=1 FL=1
METGYFQEALEVLRMNLKRFYESFIDDEENVYTKNNFIKFHGELNLNKQKLHEN